MKKNDIAKQIVKILSKHPEGLTAVDIAKEVGMHRHTVTKYVYMLLGAEEIFERQVGPAKLIYLTKKGLKK